MTTMGRDYDTPYRAKHREELRAKGLCYECGAEPEPGHAMCGFHRAYYANKSRLRRLKLARGAKL
jgi:hypothetical protein